MMIKYAIVVIGSEFGINDFLQALYRRYPYEISGEPTRVRGRYEAHLHFQAHVNDEQLKQFFALEHPYVTTVGACCCEESARI